VVSDKGSAPACGTPVENASINQLGDSIQASAEVARPFVLIGFGVDRGFRDAHFAPNQAFQQ